jgi:hypothetical protein
VSTAKLDRKGRVSGRLDEKREVEAMGRKGSGGAVEEGDGFWEGVKGGAGEGIRKGVQDGHAPDTQQEPQ